MKQMNQKTPGNNESVLRLENLVVAFDTEQGVVHAVDDISFSLEQGSVLGIAGESGCGKSVTALSILRLLPKPVSRIVSGKIWFDGNNILELPIDQLQFIRGKKNIHDISGTHDRIESCSCRGAAADRSLSASFFR